MPPNNEPVETKPLRSNVESKYGQKNERFLWYAVCVGELKLFVTTISPTFLTSNSLFHIVLNEVTTYYSLWIYFAMHHTQVNHEFSTNLAQLINLLVRRRDDSKPNLPSCSRDATPIYKPSSRYRNAITTFNHLLFRGYANLISLSVRTFAMTILDTWGYRAGLTGIGLHLSKPTHKVKNWEKKLLQ